MYHQCLVKQLDFFKCLKEEETSFQLENKCFKH